MTTSHSELRLNVRHLLVPISLLSVTIMLMLSYQTVQIMRDRDSLNVAKGQQEKAYADGQRLQSQLNALLMGTQKLADEGNKNAKVITDKLKDMGIQVASNANKGPAKAQGGVTPAPVPAAAEQEDTGPVKP